MRSAVGPLINSAGSFSCQANAASQGVMPPMLGLLLLAELLKAMVIPDILMKAADAVSIEQAVNTGVTRLG